VTDRGLLDVNVLVAALRQDAAHHAVAVEWLEQARAAGTRVLVLVESLVAAARVLSNPRIWVDPTPVNEAVETLDQLIEAIDAEVVGAGISVWSEFADVARAHALTTRMVPDALLVAAARVNGASVTTLDRGLAEYPGVVVDVLS
jgi:toxin-antitoxin system PIN domain toxin